MANMKAAKKHAKASEKKRKTNVARRSDVKTAIKQVLEALSAKDVAKAENLFNIAQSKIARARGKGLIKDNTAARKISRLAQRLQQVSAL